MGTPETFSRQDALEFFDLGEPQYKGAQGDGFTFGHDVAGGGCFSAK